LPLPAPATLALLTGARMAGVEGEAELVTPTGAAIAAVVVAEWGPLPPLILRTVGYGAGSRDLAERPNVLRVIVGDRVAAPRERDVVLLETNLDDLNPQLVPDAVERCVAAGALDVWVTPVQMKKSRPGIVLAALARPGLEGPVAEAMLAETTTLGVRITPMRRLELEREEQTVTVDGAPVRIKVGWLDGRVVNVAPEHDDCVAVAHATGRSVKAIWASALAAAERM
jgi:pyridinium-3,5-bisthiocarboxylic acid mononucleotide nickel chelatase